MENDYLIYKHTSPSGKAYIGQTNNYKKRCKAHLNPINNCRLFYNAIQKYGWDSFKHEIIRSGLTKEQANMQEEFCIKIYKTQAPYGYNLKAGGNNQKHREETKILISKAKKGIKNPLVGEANKLRVISEETRTKLKGKVSPMKNLEVCKKVSESKKLEYVFISPDNNVFYVKGLETFSIENGLRPEKMAMVARKERKSHRNWKCFKLDDYKMMYGNF